MSKKETVVLYHSGCFDGFGGAYAAWKKFGDDAEYIPVTHNEIVPEGLDGRKLIFIDFSYPQEIMSELIKTASSIVVLDHHLGTKKVVENVPEHIFDEKHSGAIIAWNYFHPNIPVPLLFKYIEDGDRYTFSLPNSREILAYVYTQRFDFEEWSHLIQELEDENALKLLIEKGKHYSEYHSVLVEQMTKKAVLVSFEGFECYLITATDMFKSDVAHRLADLKPPLGIAVNLHGDVMNVSLRSDPSLDVSVIAQKYGGNGHPQAAGFRIKWGDPLPWKVLNENENLGN